MFKPLADTTERSILIQVHYFTISLLVISAQIFISLNWTLTETLSGPNLFVDGEGQINLDLWM